MSIPGIGWIAASQLLTRIGDWRQIDNVRQLGSFLGLVPTENSTDGTVDRGSITRAGDGRLRSNLFRRPGRQSAKIQSLESFIARCAVEMDPAKARGSQLWPWRENLVCVFTRS
jgi:transposase